MKLNRLSLLILPLSIATAAHAADNISTNSPSSAISHTGAIERSGAKRATDLMERAVDYLQKYGTEKSFSAFNERKSAFVSNEFYVYVVGLDGIMYASGGDSNRFVGTNVLGLHDAAGKYFIREMLEKAKTSDSGMIEYNWLNHIDNHVEIKTTQFRKVDNYLVCVGYYIPRASREEASALLERAVTLLKKSGGNTAFKAFNDPQSGFLINDEYVFAFGLNDGKYRASGAAPHLTGTDVMEMTDAAGKYFFKEMVAMAKRNDSGSIDYLWRNPATNAVEEKHTLFQRVDDVLLGVGYYTKK